MSKQLRISFVALTAMLFAFAASAFGATDHKPASSIPAANLIQPADFAKTLKNSAATKPLILQVGFRTMYDQAHIPGAEYAGPGRSDEGLQLLKTRVASVSKDADIVLYCGCCPWSRCPNVAAAFDTLQSLGFKHVKVIYIADNFGADWVDKGYPVVK